MIFCGFGFYIHEEMSTDIYIWNFESFHQNMNKILDFSVRFLTLKYILSKSLTK